MSIFPFSFFYNIHFVTHHKMYVILLSISQGKQKGKIASWLNGLKLSLRCGCLSQQFMCQIVSFLIPWCSVSINNFFCIFLDSYLVRDSCQRLILRKHSMHSILRITCLTLRKCFRSGLKGMKHKQTNQNETEERPDIAFLVH